MKPEHWRQLDQLFQEASEREPAARAAFLSEACAGDEELRRKLENLLAAHDEAGSFIENRAIEVQAQAIAREEPTSQMPMVQTGQTINHYRIERRLGAGAMGEVYLAQDLKLRRNVALKLLPALFTGSPERLRRFENEARAASALNHPNILTIYEIGEADSIHYIASEFVNGVTLRDFMQGKSISLLSALDVAAQIAGALVAAHTKGIVHRDIKPENIMISRVSSASEVNVKVLDFGIAKLTEAEAVETELPTRPMVSTSEGMTMGTVPYMSPEQAQGMKVDGRTDIWSLGVVLYEMIAGRPPFTGPTRSHVIVSILESEPVPIGELTEVPESLEWIIAKALRKERDDRYQTARELHHDLKDLRQRLQQARTARRAAVEGLDADERAVVRRQDSPSTATDKAARTIHTTSIGPVRRTWMLLGILLLAAVAVGLAAKVVWPRLTANKTRVPFSAFKVSKLTTTGKASSAAISPDGKYVVHVKQLRGQFSLWLKHIATGSDKEIVSPDGSELASLSFSPDGDHIYFIKKAKDITLNEVPVLGGQAKQLVTDIDTAAAVSPDGKKFAFIRGHPTTDEAALLIANADGTGETAVVTHSMREIFGQIAATPAWSPDGETIVFALQKTIAGERQINLAAVRVKDRVENALTSGKWGGIESICWSPDGRGVFFTASDADRANAQIWHATYPAGVARRITVDPNNYENLTITADGAGLVTVLSEGASDVWVIEGDATSARQITSSRFDGIVGLAWTTDGRIVHVSRASGNPDIWIMNADGSQDRQLTSNQGRNIAPSTSPDGRYIVFASDRSGSWHIWRMDLDGRQQTELTYGADDTQPVCSRDGKWVIFTSHDKKTSLWKVPIEGGSPTQLSDFNAGHASVSSKDGSILYTFTDLQANPIRFKIGLMAAEGGPPLKLFDVPQFFGTLGPATYGQQVRWAPEGRAITYIDNRDAVGNIWSQPIDGGPPKQLTNFQSEMIFNYACSPDGKKLAVARGSKTSDVVLISDVNAAP